MTPRFLTAPGHRQEKPPSHQNQEQSAAHRRVGLLHELRGSTFTLCDTFEQSLDSGSVSLCVSVQCAASVLT